MEIIGLDDLDIVSTRNPDGTLGFIVRGSTGIEIIEAQAKLFDMTPAQYVAEASLLLSMERDNNRAANDFIAGNCRALLRFLVSNDVCRRPP